MALPATSGLHICSLNCQLTVGACVHHKILGCGKGYFSRVSVCFLPTDRAQLCPGPTLSVSGSVNRWVYSVVTDPFTPPPLCEKDPSCLDTSFGGKPRLHNTSPSLTRKCITNPPCSQVLGHPKDFLLTTRENIHTNAKYRHVQGRTQMSQIKYDVPVINNH